MRILFLYLIWLCSGIGGAYVYAQEKCAADEFLNIRLEQLGMTRDEYAAQLSQYMKSMQRRRAPGARIFGDKTYKIPVVFHIFHYQDETVPKEEPRYFNIPAKVIQRQLDTLNYSFAETRKAASRIPAKWQRIQAGDVGIRFYLAQKDTLGFPMDEPGIHRISLPMNKPAEDVFSPLPHEMLRKTEWDISKYLNIYVLPHLLTGGTGGLAPLPTLNIPGIHKGWTHPRTLGGRNLNIGNVSMGPTLRGWEGVMVATPEMPIKNFSLYDIRGLTLVHEVGHYLGLFHNFGFCREDDYCDDTPVQSFPGKSFVGGDPTGCGLENVEDCDGEGMPANYMDYSDEVCILLFTACQRDRMRATMEYAPFRRSLWQSEDKITPVIAQENDLGILSFTERTSACGTGLQGGLTVGNYGTNAITSLKIELFLNGTKVSTLTKTGIRMARYTTEEITFDPITVRTGNIILEASVLTVNGTTDPNSDNNVGRYTTYHAATASDPFFTEDFEDTELQWIIPAGNTAATVVATADNSGKMLAFRTLNSHDGIHNGYTILSPALDFSALPSDKQAVLSFRYNYRASLDKTAGAFFVAEIVECSAEKATILDYRALFDANVDIFQPVGQKPQYDHQWRTINLPLPEVSSSTQLLIGLFSYKGPDLYIDDIQIQKKPLSSGDLSVENIVGPPFYYPSNPHVNFVASYCNYSNETIRTTFAAVVKNGSSYQTPVLFMAGGTLLRPQNGRVSSRRNPMVVRAERIMPHSSFKAVFTIHLFAPSHPSIVELNFTARKGGDSNPLNNIKKKYVHLSTSTANMPVHPLSTEAGSNFKWYPATSTQNNSDWRWGLYKGNHLLQAPLYNNDQISEGAYLKLISQPISLENYTAPTLSFYVAYAQQGTVEDRLRLFVFEDSVYMPTKVLYNKAGARLATEENNWRKELIDLSPYAGKQLLHFMFVATHEGGNDIYLDNIGLHNTAHPTVTAPPGTAPTSLSALSASILSITATSAALSLTSIQAGTLYWVLLAGSNTTAPSAAELINGTGPAGAAPLNNGRKSIKVNTALTLTISGLRIGTSYKIYFMVRDRFSNNSSIMEKTFTTTSDLSTIFGTSTAETNNEVSLYPNPFTKKVQLLLNLRQPQDIQVSFMDVSGRVAWQQRLKYVGPNVFTLQPHLKSNQLYYASIKSKFIKKILRVVVK